jgi:hypothetical protein
MVNHIKNFTIFLIKFTLHSVAFWQQSIIHQNSSVCLHQSRLHHREDIFFLVKATVVMNNMMLDISTFNMDMESDDYHEVLQELDDDIMTMENDVSGDNSIVNVGQILLVLLNQLTRVTTS